MWKHGDLPVAIDPATCGCTECIIGEYAPDGSALADKAFEALANGWIDDLSSNTGESYIVWRGYQGRTHVETLDYNPRSYEAVHLDTTGPAIVWIDSSGEAKIKVLDDCDDVDSVKFVIDN